MILIASACPETLVRLKPGLQDFSAVLSVAEGDSLKVCISRLKPRMLLVDLDLPGLNGVRGIAALRKSDPAPRIIALCPALSDEAELGLFQAGVSGCCRIDTDAQHLKRIVMAVDRGELWMRRALVPRLLDETRPRSLEAAGPAGIASLADLTQREREIAVLIGSGESNKQIARRLAITERTVKAHLSEIFRKFGIADRLNLALRMMASAAMDRAPRGEEVSALPMAPEFRARALEPVRSDA
jgi:two-component system NarL family response regulator